MQNNDLTAPVGTVARQSRQFLKGYKNRFWDLFKPVVLPLIVLLGLSFYINYLQAVYLVQGAMPQTMQGAFEVSNTKFQESLTFPATWGGIIISFLMIYCMAVFIIAWLRFSVYGTPEKVTLLQADRDSLCFVGYVAGFQLIAPLLLMGLVGLNYITAFILYIGLPVLYVRGCFYLIAKALGEPITFWRAMSLSQGYNIKMWFAFLRATFRLLMGMLLALVVAYALSAFTTAFMDDVYGFYGLSVEQARDIIRSNLFSIVSTFYFFPLLSGLVIMIMCYYYRIAVNQDTQSKSQ